MVRRTGLLQLGGYSRIEVEKGREDLVYGVVQASLREDGVRERENREAKVK